MVNVYTNSTPGLLEFLIWCTPWNQIWFPFTPKEIFSYCILILLFHGFSLSFLFIFLIFLLNDVFLKISHNMKGYVRIQDLYKKFV